MPDPAFYDQQRRRFSTWGVPRFLHSFDETLDGRLVLPRGLAGLLASTVREAGGALEIDDRRADGTLQQFVLTATLRDDQADAVADLADHDHGVLVGPYGYRWWTPACIRIGHVQAGGGGCGAAIRIRRWRRTCSGCSRSGWPARAWPASLGS